LRREWYYMTKSRLFSSLFVMLKKNAANIVTLLRIIFIPLLVKTATYESKDSFVLLSVGLISSDMIDGVLARKLKIATNFGRKLDIFADWVFYSSIIGILIFTNKDIVFQYWPFIITPILLHILPKFVALYYMKRFSTMHFITWKIAAFLFFFICVSLFFFKFSFILLLLLNVVCFIAFLEEIIIYVTFKEETNEDCLSLWQLLKKGKQ